MKVNCLVLTRLSKAPKIRKEKEADDHFISVQKSSLANLLRKLLCPTYNSPGISFMTREDKKSGFAAVGPLFCTTCVDVYRSKLHLLECWKLEIDELSPLKSSKRQPLLSWE